MWSPPQILAAATEIRFPLEKMVRTEFVRTRLAVSVVRFEPLILLCDQIDHLPSQRLKMNRCSRKIW